MSTYMYLECLEHDPPLRSEGEVGQHAYDLPDIRKMIKNRELLADLAKQDMPVSWDHHFNQNAACFLVQHIKCRIGIRDEYSRAYNIEEGLE